MRRVARHVFAAVAVSAVAAGVAVVGLTDVGESAANAVPAVNATPSVSGPADTNARSQRVSRAEARPEVGPVQARPQAGQQAADFGDKGRAIALHRAELEAKRQAEAEKAKAKKRADAAKKRAEAAKQRKAAAKKAERERIKKLGYQAGTTDPREITKQILKNKHHYGNDQYRCFNNVIIRESDWDVHATNPSSGAYGIPQALPGSKMASAGADWRTNPATQITWAIDYMKDRYGSPCGAWGFKSSHGWY